LILRRRSLQSLSSSVFGIPNLLAVGLSCKSTGAGPQ
jgi:hypothetical protein